MKKDRTSENEHKNVEDHEIRYKELVMQRDRRKDILDVSFLEGLKIHLRMSVDKDDWDQIKNR
jgi:hypothetical protein